MFIVREFPRVIELQVCLFGSEVKGVQQSARSATIQLGPSLVVQQARLRNLPASATALQFVAQEGVADSLHVVHADSTLTVLFFRKQ